MKPAQFSFKPEGPCPNCNGVGAIETVVAMMASQQLFGDGDAHALAAAQGPRPPCDIGLGHLRLGPPPATLSGGERQRLEAGHTAEKGAVRPAN